MERDRRIAGNVWSICPPPGSVQILVKGKWSKVIEQDTHCLSLASVSTQERVSTQMYAHMCTHTHAHTQSELMKPYNLLKDHRETFKTKIGPTVLQG